MTTAGYIATYAILLACGFACFTKGKVVFAALGLLLPIFWLVGAVRPAKPDSIWARRFGSRELEVPERGDGRG